MIVRIINAHSLGGGVDVEVGALLEMSDEAAARKIARKDAEPASEADVERFKKEQAARAAAAKKAAAKDAGDQ